MSISVLLPNCILSASFKRKKRITLYRDDV